MKAFPQAETAPEVWILGSSDYGAPARGPCSACPIAMPGSSATAPAASAPSISTKRSYRPRERVRGRARPPRRRWPPDLDGRLAAIASPALGTHQRRPGPAAAARQAAPAPLADFQSARVEQFLRTPSSAPAPRSRPTLPSLKERVGVDEMAVVTWTPTTSRSAATAPPNSRPCSFAP